MSTSDQKSENFHYCLGAQNTGTKRPKSTTELQPCNQDERIWSKNEKSIQVKLLDFYKSKTNKSCVDIFSFLQPRLTMTQTMELARLPFLGKTSTLLPSKQNCKKEGFFKLRKHGIHRKSVRRIEKKNIVKNNTLDFLKQLSGTQRPWKEPIEVRPCNQKETN